MSSIMEDFYSEETDATVDLAEAKAGRWTAEEHALFLQGLKLYSKQWKQIAELVKTRTVVQIRTHAQKYFQKMEKQNGKRSKYSDADGLEEGGSRSSSDSRSEDENPPYCFRSSTQQAHVSSATTSEGESDEPDSPLPPPSSPRKRGRDKKQSGLTLNLRVSKRPNVRSESDLSLESAVSFSMASSYDEFLPLVEEEGEELDESIYNLLDKIDWHAESRVHSPFMDSAASVSTSLDSLEALPFFDFASAHLNFGHDSFPMPFSVQRIVVPPPPPLPMTSATLPPVPEQADPESLKVHKTVIQEIKQIVHGGPRVANNAKGTKYDKLPSIRALMSMTASGMSVQCPQSLTPSNSLVHYQMVEDQIVSGMTSSEHSPRAKEGADALFLHLDYDEKKVVTVDEPTIAIRMPLGVASQPVATSHSPPL